MVGIVERTGLGKTAGIAGAAAAVVAAVVLANGVGDMGFVDREYHAVRPTGQTLETSRELSDSTVKFLTPSSTANRVAQASSSHASDLK